MITFNKLCAAFMAAVMLCLVHPHGATIIVRGPIVAGGGAATTLEDEISADSPVAWWKLGESSGTTADDAIGTNDLTYTGGYTLGATGLTSPGTSVSLNGSTGYITDTTPDSVLDITGDITVEVLVKPSSAPSAYSTIVAHVYTTTISDRQYQLDITNTNKFRGVVFIGSTAYEAVGTTTVSGGTTYHVAMVRSGTNLYLYVNGVQEGSVGSVSGSLNVLTFSEFSIGRLGAYNGDYWGGDIQHVAVYDTALSGTRITAHNNAK